MEKQELVQWLMAAGEIHCVRALRHQWAERRYSYQKRPRPHYGFLLLLQGTIRYEQNGQVLDVHPGDMVFLPKGCFYDAHFSQDTGPVVDLLVNFLCAEPAILSLPQTPTVILSGVADVFADLFTHTITAYERGAQAHFLLHSHFCLLLHRLVTMLRRDSMDGDQRLVAAAKELLIAPQKRSVAQIAHLCAASESSLRRKFRQCEGITPTEYRQRWKIEQAKRLLLSTDMSLAQIADELEFFDEAHFSRQFSRHTGMTPGAFRNHLPG